jgi:CelD/BcsL family acetyltransferase involved in cellulose biosynthesis
LEVDRLLDWFFPTKAAHLEKERIADDYTRPGVEEFIRAACHRGLAEGEPSIELYAIEGDGELLAVLGGTSHNRRFSSMFITYTLGPHARLSPGRVLLTHLCVDLEARGFVGFDLGAGDAPYKRGICDRDLPLFDTLLPMTPLGHLDSVFTGVTTSTMRLAKRSPKVWLLLRKLHGKLSRL